MHISLLYQFAPLSGVVG